MGIGGVEYIVQCITGSYEADNVQWQWLLGRLLMLDRLIDEHPMEFIVKHDSECCEEVNFPPEHLTNYNQLMSIIRFCLNALSNSHTKVAKEAKRVFIMAARLTAHQPAVFHQIMEMLSNVDSTLQLSMKKRLRGVAGEFHVAQKMAWMVQQGASSIPLGAGNEPYVPPHTTPEETPTPCVTPYSTSPPASPLPTVMVNIPPSSPLQRPTTIPIAPPNSPQHRRSEHIQPNNHETASTSLFGLNESRDSDDLHLQHSDDHSNSQGSTVSGMLTPPNTPKRQWRPPCQSSLINRLTDLCHSEAGPLTNETGHTSGGDSGGSGAYSDSETSEQNKTNLAEGGVSSEPCMSNGSINGNNHRSSSKSLSATTLHKKLLTDKVNQSWSHTSGAPVDYHESRSSPSPCLPSPSSPSTSTPCTPCTPCGFSSTVLLTEDLSDLTMSPSSPENSAQVSFKTEVAVQSPQHSNNGSSGEYYKIIN